MCTSVIPHLMKSDTQNVPYKNHGFNRRTIARFGAYCLLLEFLYLFSKRATRVWDTKRELLNDSQHHRHVQNPSQPQNKQRILYIVTSIAEFDNGRRATIEGYDRFSNSIVPVVRASVKSMVDSGFTVDVYFVTHYNMSTVHYSELSSQLPISVGLQVWEDATPLGYGPEPNETESIRVRLITRGLSRQHRYVIKDKNAHYDLFVCFEDDMLVRGAHVDHFVNVTNALYQLRSGNNELATLNATNNMNTTRFYGPLNNQQLARIIPGFMRVEAVLPGYKPRNQNRYEQIPIDYQWEADQKGTGIDPSICCHISSQDSNARRPAAPDKDELFFWETSIDALGVRNIPNVGWVLLLGGTNDANLIGDYWSGQTTEQFFGNGPRPDRKKGRYISNQGGWMATKQQIMEWHSKLCLGGFLPPFDLPHHKSDGLHMRSVEYWSGGIQLAGSMSCVLQRVVTLDPGGFSRHILYHTSNNKQRSANVLHRFSGRSINQFWGQLNTIRKSAEKRMREELLQMAEE